MKYVARVRNLSGVFVGMLMFTPCLLTQNRDRANTEPTIVFVCEHGAAKSIIAAAEFNRLAEQNGLPQRAISRGTNPDPQFAPNVIAGLKKNGLAVPSGKPKMLTSADVGSAERVVTLGCNLPEHLTLQNKPVNWPDISPPSNYDAARADTMRHIQQLVNEFIAQGSKK